MHRAGAAARAVAALLLGVALAGCSRDVSQEQVEQSIREAMAEQGAVISSLDCPGDLPPELDARMICQVDMDGLLESGVEVDRIRVVVTEVAGREVRYRLEPLAVGAPDDAPAPDDSAATESPTG
ncbi:DUF4333 domain-containing protein [Ornithinicoccus halotolerans]|uniref:DUF4333 domain-containing protein n=1 Tax=Ornithinicoccus halotolerans TaxID=1748220 RepID=UPI001885FA4C|nr:DUF4333 domain-containing protein [Ornithinicoccus halotolerans]